MSATAQDTPDDGFRLGTFFPYRMSVVIEHLARVFEIRALGSAALTIPEWRILAIVAQHGVLSPTAVGHLTTMDKVKVSRAAQSLAARALVRQTRDPRDGRGRLLRLTRKGTNTYSAIVPLARTLEATLYDSLGRGEQAALDRILTKLGARIDAIAAEIAAE